MRTKRFGFPVSEILSEALQGALNACSQDAAADMGEGGDDAECVAEACFSMLDFGYPAERAELTAAIKLHGYDVVLKEAAKVVATR